MISSKYELFYGNEVGGGSTGGGNSGSSVTVNVTDFSQSDVGANPYVNLATGRLRYSFADVNVGYGNFALGVSHIYAGARLSAFSGKFSEYGNGWKLNLSQCIVKSGEAYLYMGESGDARRFVHFDGNRYYDDNDAKTVLKVYENDSVTRYIIEDGAGNKLYFNADGYITESVSCCDSSMRKIFNYQNNRLVSVYDNRFVKQSGGAAKSRIELGYDNGKLSTVTAYVNFNKILYQLKYEYDQNGNLLAVDKIAYGKTKPCLSVRILQFGYNGNSLSDVTYCETKSAYTFEYDNSGRLAKASQGVIATNGLTLGAADSAGNVIASDVTQCGAFDDTTFVPKKSNAYTYAFMSDSDKVAYKANITNENGINIEYYIDRCARITSSFERVGGNLKTLQKQGAKTVKYCAVGENINGNDHGVAPNGKITQVFHSFDIARNDAEKSYKHFNYEFWLKTQKTYNVLEAKATFKFLNSYEDVVSTVTVNPYAQNAWQKVCIPFTIPNGFKTADLPLITISMLANKQTADCTDRFEINQIGFEPAPKTDLYFAENASLPELTSISFLEYKDMVYSNKRCNIGQAVYFTEGDILATYANKYTSNLYPQGVKVFDVICNNGTRRLPNFNTLTFCFTDGKTAAMGNSVFTDTLTTDGSTEIKTEYIYSSGGITVKTTGERDGKKSSAQTVMNYKGQTLSETDEYKVKTEYTYDNYGNLTNERVLDGDNVVGSTVTYYYDDEGRLIKTRDGQNGVLTEYNDYDQIASVTEGKVVNSELQPTTHKITNEYGIYRDEPMQTAEYDNTAKAAYNKVTYKDGRIRTVTDGTAKYGVKYDLAADKVEYTQFDGDTEIVTQTDVITKNNDGTQIHTTTYCRDDTVSTTVDKYGKMLAVNENTANFEYAYNSIDESEFTNKPKLLKSNKQNITEYCYDYDGNLSGWKDLRDNFEVKKISADTTKYSCGNVERFSSLQYDENAILSPRIVGVKHYADKNSEYDDPKEESFYNVYYNYDSLGKLTQKRFEVKRSKYDYKYKTVGGKSLLSELRYSNFDGETPSQNGGLNIQSKDAITYNDAGDISRLTKTCSWTNGNGTIGYKTISFKTDVEYRYDSLHRITQEKDLVANTTTKYEYSSDGRLSKIGDKKLYYYNGLLTDYGDVYFEFDEFGNKVTKIKDGLLTSYIYNNGGQLTQVKDIATFGYNAEGIRESKSALGAYTKYSLDGNRIIRENRNGDIYDYIYDADELIAVDMRDGKYRYILDSEGSVVMLIYEVERDVAAYYTYDRNGKCTVYDQDGKLNTDAEFVGNRNPFRWKGFYYDQETGLYYANGSYYDPDIGQYLDMAPVSTVIESALTTRSLDRNGLVCNNILELASNVNATTELSEDPTYNGNANLPWYVKTKRWILQQIVKVTEWYNGVPWYIKLCSAAVLFAAAIAITVLTKGQVLPLIKAVVISTLTGIGIWGISTAITSETLTLQGLGNAAIDAFLFSSAITFICSAVNVIRYLVRSRHVTTAELAHNSNPPNNGAVPGTEQDIILQPGKYGRYGDIGPKSDYITNAGASPSQLSLPPWNNGKYIEIEVLKPIEGVKKAIVAPWKPWGGVGGGIQYLLPRSIQELKTLGYLIY